MKVKVIKIGIVMSLLLGVLVTSPLAGDSAYSRYNIASSGKNWYEAPGSYNTKASSGGMYLSGYMPFGGEYVILN